MTNLANHRKSRLRELIDAAPFGGSQSAFAAKLGLSEGRISQLLSAGTAFGERSARRIAQELRLGDNYFEQGFLPTALEAPVLPKGSQFDKNAKYVNVGKREYPVISYIQAGAVAQIQDPYPPGAGFDVEVSDDIWSKWTFALELIGDSMLPEFRAGDRVLIDPTLAPNPGDFVAAKNGSNEATFKKYRVRGINPGGTEVFDLVPLNEDYATLSSDAETLTIIGVMVEHRKRYRNPVFRKTILRGNPGEDGN